MTSGVGGRRLVSDFARLSFSYAAPVIWNSLPREVMMCDSEHSFKRHLKTLLFNCCHHADRLTDTSLVPLQPSVGIYMAL